MRRRLWQSFSAGGILLGTLFFAAALTPTLLPRNFVTQGMLSGLSLAAGYGIGAFGRWLWGYMELPKPRGRLLWIAKLAETIGCAIVAVIYLWRAAQWQNSIRELMQLEPVDTAHPLEVGLIALVVFTIMMALARLFRLTFHVVEIRIKRFLPRRVSNVIGVIAAVALFWAVISGVLFRVSLPIADSSFQAWDELVEPETRQ